MKKNESLIIATALHPHLNYSGVTKKKSDFEQLLNYIVRSLADNNMDENDESLSFQKWKLKHIWFPFLDSPATPRTRNNSKIECKVKDCLNEPLEDLIVTFLNFGNPHTIVSIFRFMHPQIIFSVGGNISPSDRCRLKFQTFQE